MPPFESDWKIQDEEDEDELEEHNLNTQKDAILFCIEVTPGILEPRVSESGEQECSALEAIFRAAADLQKRKIAHGPGDAVGIMLFRTSETKGEIVKPHMYLYQHISQVNAPDIQNLLQLLNEAEDNPECFPTLFSPSDQPVTMANVFLTCSHVLRDGVPKATSKRIFFFTDNDDPELGDETKTGAARHNVNDLYDLGIYIHPFFMVQPGQPFDVHKFYSTVFFRTEDMTDDVTLNVHTSFKRLLDNMRMHEAIKRTLFNIPMEFGDGLAIGIKAYGLVTEQRKGSYKYFSNMGKSMEEAFPKTVYIDEEQEREVPKESIVFGYQFGTGGPGATDEEGTVEEDAPMVKDKVFYTPEEMRMFRTFGMKPSIKILGFKDNHTIPFDANVKHSIFIFPNEAAVTGSIRTFKALLDSMLKKQKYALTRCLFRKNSSPVFCAMIPQAEELNEDNNVEEPAGFHLIPLPFADDIRQPTVERSNLVAGSPELRKAALDIIDRMKYRHGYIPYQYFNPALELHYGFLQAEAFGEEYNPEEDFNDSSAPRFQAIHKRTGDQMDAWHEALDQDPEAAEMAVEPKAGSKRKAGSVDELVVRAHFDDDTLNKLTVEQLKTYLKAHSQPYSGRKNDLIERVHDWCATHPV